jgi:Ca2+-binding EF-hand superfamily protein
MSVVRADPEVAPWGGGCPWQYDKTAFKNWLKNAFANPRGKERRELYGFVAECFLDADGDRDGLVGQDEFDFLIENAAALPRRFGLAPSWVECYGDVAHRQQARAQMFSEMDKHKRGKIGMEEWVQFVMNHIEGKVATMPMDTLDFCHLENSGAQQFIDFLGRALADRHSEEFKSLYEFLFKTFVESDVDENGAITRAQFDILIEDAAQAPRKLGLAPTTAQTYPTEASKVAARDAEFAAMDIDRAGTVTFDKFMNWAITHIAGKVQEAQSGARPVPAAQPVTYVQPQVVQPAQYVQPAQVVEYVQPAPAVEYIQQAPVSYAAPAVTYAAPVTYQSPTQFR